LVAATVFWLEKLTWHSSNNLKIRELLLLSCNLSQCKFLRNLNNVIQQSNLSKNLSQQILICRDQIRTSGTFGRVHKSARMRCSPKTQRILANVCCFDHQNK
jgi:hypothetical protein